MVECVAVQKKHLTNGCTLLSSLIIVLPFCDSILEQSVIFTVRRHSLWTYTQEVRQYVLFCKHTSKLCNCINEYILQNSWFTLNLCPWRTYISATSIYNQPQLNKQVSLNPCKYVCPGLCFSWKILWKEKYSWFKGLYIVSMISFFPWKRTLIPM